MVEKVLVKAEEWLLRRSYCSPLKNFLNPDGTATSRVFKLRPKDQGRLSVNVKSLTNFYTSVGDQERFILFEIANVEIIQQGLQTEYDPLEDGSNDAHAVIVGIDEDDEMIPRRLAAKARRVAAPW